jgi:hypothetical protein
LVLALVVAFGLGLGACGSSGADDAVETSTTSGSSSTVPATSDVPISDDVGTETTMPTATTATTTTAAPADEAWSDTFQEISLNATEPGPRPLLAWGDVDGAALYQLTVLDADGIPYWSWSGTTAAVPLGGMDNPDAIGAWVFEELTWTVVARAGDGTPLAMSQRGTLVP